MRAIVCVLNRTSTPLVLLQDLIHILKVHMYNMSGQEVLHVSEAAGSSRCLWNWEYALWSKKIHSGKKGQAAVEGATKCFHAVWLPTAAAAMRSLLVFPTQRSFN